MRYSRANLRLNIFGNEEEGMRGRYDDGGGDDAAAADDDDDEYEGFEKNGRDNRRMVGKISGGRWMSTDCKTASVKNTR